MMKLVTLSKYELVNFLGINELRKVKNPTAKKQKGFIFGMLIFLYICLAGYTAGQAIILGVCGTAEYIPILFFLSAFAMNLVVGIYRAKSTIYRESDLELVSAFPLSGVDLAASRVSTTVPSDPLCLSSSSVSLLFSSLVSLSSLRSRSRSMVISSRKAFTSSSL